MADVRNDAALINTTIILSFLSKSYNLIKMLPIKHMDRVTKRPAQYSKGAHSPCELCMDALIIL